MIQHFEKLSAEETEKMVNAISLITILIAGADGKIDRRERSWAEKVAKIRTFCNPNELHDYYIHVGQSFANRLDQFIDSLPTNSEERCSKIALKLSSLNEILIKLEPYYAASLYQSFLSFAKHVAKASGGFLGFGRINRSEMKWIKLPMLKPIVPPGEAA